MFEFIHCADIHLDSPLRGLERYEGAPVEEIRLATRRALINMVSLAIERSVSFVIIAGDLFDGDWKDYNTGLFFVNQMARLREASIPVYIVKGNHDAANKITKALKLPHNVHTFSHNRPQTFRLDDINVALHGQSFATVATQTNLALGYPEPVKGFFNIGVLHTCATGREGHETCAPCSLSDLASKGYDYWALGHVHKREVLAQEPLIIFPGNIQGRHAKETGAKGCTIVSVDDKLVASQSFAELCVLRWETCSIDLSEAQSEPEVITTIQAALNELAAATDEMPLAIRVELTGDTKFNTALRSQSEYWTNQIRALGTDAARDRIWIEKVKFETKETKPAFESANLDGPVHELAALIEEFRNDKDEMAVLRSELEEIEKKLPLEVKGQLDWHSQEFLLEALNDAEDILVERLVTKGRRE